MIDRMAMVEDLQSVPPELQPQQGSEICATSFQAC